MGRACSHTQHRQSGSSPPSSAAPRTRRTHSGRPGNSLSPKTGSHYACSHCGLHHYARSHAGFNWHSEAHARIPGAHPAPAHLSNDRTHARTHDSTQAIPHVRRTHARWNACIPSRVHQELRPAIVRIARWLCTRQCHIFIIYIHMYMCAFVRVRCARLGWMPTERYEGTPFGSPMH